MAEKKGRRQGSLFSVSMLSLSVSLLSGVTSSETHAKGKRERERDGVLTVFCTCEQAKKMVIAVLQDRQLQRAGEGTCAL